MFASVSWGLFHVIHLGGKHMCKQYTFISHNLAAWYTW